MIEVECFFCKEIFTSKESLRFREECGKCRNDLHICKNCKFYDPSAYNECREPQVDPIREKERSNTCEYFVPKERGGKTTSKDQLLSAAELLFKKK